jgi:hypothetical protein
MCPRDNYSQQGNWTCSQWLSFNSSQLVPRVGACLSFWRSLFIVVSFPNTTYDLKLAHAPSLLTMIFFGADIHGQLRIVRPVSPT